MPSTPVTPAGPVITAPLGSPLAATESSPALGAAIALLAVLFIAATGLFMTRGVSQLEMLHRTISARSQADYAFTLEQRVAPQRAVSAVSAVTTYGTD